MILIRLLGRLFLLGAILSLIHDGTQTLLRGNGILITPLVQHWYDLSPATLTLAHQAFQNSLPWLWDGLIANILSYPGWIVFGSIGIVISYLGRRRKRVIIYAN